ncbi:MAG: hypothetical protein IKO19_00500 [Candidatus Riflebacteria bacterium]|nr:hypothetical protein [Candidatus Riflebacteria bacterium]
MNRSKLNKVAGVVFMLASLLAFSNDTANAQSVRSRGMGGAFIGLSNDESATIYNPAGLSQIEGREASIQAKVNERDIFEWQSLAFTGHIYEGEEESRFSITDYLEHNILEEPIPRKPKYSYGFAYTQDRRYEGFGNIVGGEYLGVHRKVNDLQLAFATRFPIARRMLAREQLYGGIKIRYLEVDRFVRGGINSNRDSLSLGAGLMYHYNDQLSIGMTLDNLLEDVKGNNVKEDGVSFNIGAAYEVARGTVIAVDGINLTDSCDANERQYRVGVEKKFVENDLTMRMGSLNGTLTLGFGMNVLPNVRVDYSYYDGDIIREHYVGAHMTFD